MSSRQQCSNQGLPKKTKSMRNCIDEQANSLILIHSSSGSGTQLSNGTARKLPLQNVSYPGSVSSTRKSSEVAVCSDPATSRLCDIVLCQCWRAKSQVNLACTCRSQQRGTQIRHSWKIFVAGRRGKRWRKMEQNEQQSRRRHSA